MSIANEEIEKVIKSIRGEIESHEIVIRQREEKIKRLKEQLIAIEGRQGIPWMDKSMDCIRIDNEVKTAEEILLRIKHEKLVNLDNPKKRRMYMTALSVALGRLCKLGKLKSEKYIGTRGLCYGLPEWWDDNGELQPFYKYSLIYRQQLKKEKDIR